MLPLDDWPARLSEMYHKMVHTKLLTRAIDWERHKNESGLRIKSDADRAVRPTDRCLPCCSLRLALTTSWLFAQRALAFLYLSAMGKRPGPTTLHLSFMTASGVNDISVAFSVRHALTCLVSLAPC